MAGTKSRNFFSDTGIENIAQKVIQCVVGECDQDNWANAVLNENVEKLGRDIALTFV